MCYSEENHAWVCYYQWVNSYIRIVNFEWKKHWMDFEKFYKMGVGYGIKKKKGIILPK